MKLMSDFKKNFWPMMRWTCPTFWDVVVWLGHCNKAVTLPYLLLFRRCYDMNTGHWYVNCLPSSVWIRVILKKTLFGTNMNEQIHSYAHVQFRSMICLSIFKYKAEELVCLLERANLRNYWSDIKILSVLDSPFIVKGYGRETL
jgi:hypothetical protein